VWTGAGNFVATGIRSSEVFISQQVAILTEHQCDVPQSVGGAFCDKKWVTDSWAEMLLYFVKNVLKLVIAVPGNNRCDDDFPLAQQSDAGQGCLFLEVCTSHSR
jgi:hypothetical protein